MLSREERSLEMRTLSVLFVLSLVVLVAGCSSMRTSFDYDPTADFPQYATYAWMDRASSGPAGSGAQPSDMTGKRVRMAMDDELARRGMTVDTTNPDLLIAYYVGVEEKVDVTDWGYRYYGGWYGRDVDVYRYQMGSIVLDMVDASTSELVWRGVVTDYVSEQKSPQERERQVREAAAALLANYPPK
jgi:hypothetical protein